MNLAELAEHLSLAVLNLVTAVVAWKAGKRSSDK